MPRPGLWWDARRGRFEYIVGGIIRGALGPAEPADGQSPSLFREEALMPLFMDSHAGVEGLTAEAVAGAHKADLETQAKYGVDYKQYWFNETSGAVYCLVEAPNAEAAITVHREAHGLVADSIVEVQEGH
jgi:hypothetical protein